jgi:hypothetical protein
MIDCDVTTDSTSDEVLPFTANQNDPEPSGREIFDRCLAGEFGEIAEYVPPSEPTDPEQP